MKKISFILGIAIVLLLILNVGYPMNLFSKELSFIISIILFILYIAKSIIDLKLRKK